jgi:hypothetical protein
MAVKMISTSERNGRKRKERKDACSGEPHSGGGEGKGGGEWVYEKKKKSVGRCRGKSAAVVIAVVIFSNQRQRPVTG